MTRTLVLGLFLIVLSIFALLGGLLSLSNATMGVGVICVACYLAIMARIAQADRANKRISDLIISMSRSQD